MKIILLFILTVYSTSFACAQEDMQAYLSQTRDLIQQGDYPEALKRVLWFHEHALEHQPSMTGVRLSFALNDWLKLGELHPPAMKAMVKTRDEGAAKLRNGEGKAHLFQDVAAFNRTLDENSKTLDLFKSIEQANPPLAKQCWHFAAPIAIKEKDYNFLKKRDVDLNQWLSIRAQSLEYTRKRAKDSPIGAERLIRITEDSFIRHALMLIETANQIGKPEEAQAIRKRAASLVDDPRLRPKDR